MPNKKPIGDRSYCGRGSADDYKAFLVNFIIELSHIYGNNEFSTSELRKMPFAVTRELYNKWLSVNLQKRKYYGLIHPSGLFSYSDRIIRHLNKMVSFGWITTEKRGINRFWTLQLEQIDLSNIKLYKHPKK